MKKAYTMVEILVVLGVFTILTVILTQTIANVFKLSNKSEAEVSVREGVSHATNTIKRLLYNANGFTSCTSTGTPNPNRIDYIDSTGVHAYFLCQLIDGAGGNIGRIASGSADPFVRVNRITSDDVDITLCNFVCIPGSGGSQDAFNIEIRATSANFTGSEGSEIVERTRILLKTY